jgi:hypothetical protein
MLDASSLGAMQNRRHGGVRVSQRRTVNDLLDAARAQIDRLEPMAARAARNGARSWSIPVASSSAVRPA